MQHPTPIEMKAYRRRELPAASILAMDDHVSSCESCRQRLRECEPMADPAAVLAQLGEPHPTYEEIERYIDESARQDERRRMDGHLERCGRCRGEVADLREFRRGLEKTPAARPPALQGLPPALQGLPPALQGLPPALQGLPPVLQGLPPALQGLPPALQGLPPALQRLAAPRPRAQWLAAAAAVVVAAGALWWWSAAHRPPDIVATAVATEELNVPARVLALRGARPLVRAPGVGSGFGLLGPVGTAVIADRPRFTWKALAGASAYRVAIFTPGFRKVAESPWLASTEWTAVESLERGQVYSWQVTARMGAAEDAPTMRAPDLTDPEAKFEVVGAAEVAELERARREHPDSHLLLGRLYARAGVLDLAEQELALHAGANPQSGEVAALLDKVRALRR